MTVTRPAGERLDVMALRAALVADPDTLLVDVRTPGEFAAASIDGAVNIPLDRLDAHLRRIVHDAGGRMVLLCQSGGSCHGTAAAPATSTPTSTLRWPACAVDAVDRTREVARRSRRMVHW